MFSSDTLIRVRYIETDQMGVVYHGHYFQYFEYLYDNFGLIKSLHLYSINNILKSFLVTRR